MKNFQKSIDILKIVPSKSNMKLIEEVQSEISQLEPIRETVNCVKSTINANVNHRVFTGGRKLTKKIVLPNESQFSSNKQNIPLDSEINKDLACIYECDHGKDKAPLFKEHFKRKKRDLRVIYDPKNNQQKTQKHSSNLPEKCPYMQPVYRKKLNREKKNINKLPSKNWKFSENQKIVTDAKNDHNLMDIVDQDMYKPKHPYKFDTNNINSDYKDIRDHIIKPIQERNAIKTDTNFIDNQNKKNQSQVNQNIFPKHQFQSRNPVILGIEDQVPESVIANMNTYYTKKRSDFKVEAPWENTTYDNREHYLKKLDLITNPA